MNTILSKSLFACLALPSLIHLLQGHLCLMFVSISVKKKNMPSNTRAANTELFFSSFLFLPSGTDTSRILKFSDFLLSPRPSPRPGSSSPNLLVAPSQRGRAICLCEPKHAQAGQFKVNTKLKSVQCRNSRMPLVFH